jgi:hypothetical protein
MVLQEQLTQVAVVVAVVIHQIQVVALVALELLLYLT